MSSRTTGTPWRAASAQSDELSESVPLLAPGTCSVSLPSTSCVSYRSFSTIIVSGMVSPPLASKSPPLNFGLNAFAPPLSVAFFVRSVAQGGVVSSSSVRQVPLCCGLSCVRGSVSSESLHRDRCFLCPILTSAYNIGSSDSFVLRFVSSRITSTYLYLILLPRPSAWRRRQHAMITMVTTRMTTPKRRGSAADTSSLDSGHESAVSPGMTTCVVLVLVSTRSKHVH
ncbi:hypothetical protein NP493_659g01064 [Ridgeia piscesae]|uniref:Uncharacterized protein n=1 Tax=Ridgeia piscesae TaxID=27915 RepID=A0AAD9KS42_RIDPI|nr:hypothetical protein NP493_659g01064 [Ridgeia piscesae]